MTGPGEAAIGEGVRTSTGRGRPRFRRRSFLVDRRYQLRVAALTATIVLVLLVFLNLTLYAASVDRSDAIVRDAPELAPYVHAQDRVLVFLVVLGSAVFLVGVFLVSILETHKTAGACVNLGHRLAEIRDGQYDIELNLRRDDHLKTLEPAFNEMCSALRQRTWDDVEVLEDLASALEEGATSPDSSDVAVRLRVLADRTRRRVE
jgi:methyl-accepting chemotaxis protein